MFGAWIAAALLALGAGPGPLHPQAVVSSRGIQARLLHTTSAGRPVRLEIRRRGAILLSRRVPPWPGEHYRVDATWQRPLVVRDLDGDGEPEVVLRLNWGGTQCCAWWRVYTYRPRQRRYTASVHLWGDLAGPGVKDLDGDGAPELTTGDQRFLAFSPSGPCRFAPIRIWRVRGGRFLDVTRRFPRSVEADARAALRAATGLAACGSMPAAEWAADEALLGRARQARVQLGRWARGGSLRCPCGQWRTGAGFVSSLWRFLRRTGYLR